MALYPPRSDIEASLAAYIDETAEIPIPWLLEGVRSFKYQADRTFLPSIAEVLTACAKAVQRTRRDARGEARAATAPQYDIDVRTTLRWAAEHAPLGHAQVARLEAGRRANRAAAAENAESAARVGQGERGQSSGAALSEVLSGFRVVDEHGDVVPVQEISQKIWTEGVLVPAKSHPDKALSMLGYWIATCIAYLRLGHRPVPSSFMPEDWQRMERTVLRHAAENPKADVSWWDEVRDEWWQIAKQNEARGPS
jgi:hypothetical protein